MSSTPPPSETPWRERPAFWWALFAAGTLAILAFVPYANSIQKSVREAIGAQGVRWAMVAVVAVLAAGTVRWIYRRRAAIGGAAIGGAAIGRAGVLRFIAVPAVAAVWIAGMKVTAEAFHLIEYGLLGALAYRALAFRSSGFRAHAAAAVLTALAGGLDELVQWLTPGRFGTLSDVGLNAAGGVLAQLWIATGISRRDPPPKLPEPAAPPPGAPG